MRRLGRTRFALALLSITLVIAQVVGASLAAAKAPSYSKSVVVICSVHGQMTVESGLPDDAPSAPARHDCPCCLAGCGLVGAMAPLVSAMAYDLGEPVSLSPSPPLVTGSALPRRTGGEPASPRAPPAA